MSLVEKILREAKVLIESPIDASMINKIWYHGTSLENGLKIAQEGVLKPNSTVSKLTKGFMKPQFNKVYLTEDVTVAMSYAYFRRKNKNENCCLVIIEGSSLSDFEPDEDTIASSIPTYIKDESGNHKYLWLRNLAQNNYPKELKRYDDMGDFRYGTALGKKLIKLLTYDQKLILANIGKKLANTGELKVSEVWELSSEEENYLCSTNGAPNFRDVSKKIK